MNRYFRKLFKRKNSDEYDNILSQVKKLYEFAPVDVGGGCSFQKALTMTAFINEFDMQTTADIGVYRGRSLFPQALAHRNYSKGIVYGIDPYSNEAAIQNDRPEIKEILENFAVSTDFENIFQDVNKLINEFGLLDYCKLIRKKSEDAKLYFTENNISLDLIHIDGNHDTSFVLKDVHDYLPIVEEGGIVLLDDFSWSSVQPAFNILSENIKYIDCFSDSQNDFAIFIKSQNPDLIARAKEIIISVRNHNY